MRAHSRTAFRSTAALLALGFALQMLLWSRQWIYGDQYALLTPAVEYLETGELNPVGKTMSGGGRIPGVLLQLLVAGPLSLWADYRSPALAMGLSQVVAVAILVAVGARAYGGRVVPFLVAVYWLSPWRLYHAGFLWEPGFVLLPAALHLGCAWVLRTPRVSGRGDGIASSTSSRSAFARGLASFGIGVLLVATLQIHGSFLVLVFATVALVARRLIRLQVVSVAVGGLVGGLTLLPTLISLPGGTRAVLGLGPEIDSRMAWPVLVSSNVGKAVLYWLRMGSADIGRRLRQTAWLADPPAGTEAGVSLPPMLVSVVVVLSIASVALAFQANRRFFWNAGDSADGRRAWVRGYVLAMVSAFAVAAAVSPVPIQGWHLVIGLHAACIPPALWLSGCFERGGAARLMVVGFVSLLAVTDLLIGLGHPMYMRPDNTQIERQDIGPELRVLISGTSH